MQQKSKLTSEKHRNSSLAKKKSLVGSTRGPKMTEIFPANYKTFLVSFDQQVAKFSQ